MILKANESLERGETRFGLTGASPRVGVASRKTVRHRAWRVELPVPREGLSAEGTAGFEESTEHEAMEGLDVVGLQALELDSRVSPAGRATVALAPYDPAIALNRSTPGKKLKRKSNLRPHGGRRNHAHQHACARDVAYETELEITALWTIRAQLDACQYPRPQRARVTHGKTTLKVCVHPEEDLLEVILFVQVADDSVAMSLSDLRASGWAFAGEENRPASIGKHGQTRDSVLSRVAREVGVEDR